MEGLTQAALAAAISRDRTAVSRMESDRRRIGSLELESIARRLNRPIDWFFAEDSAARQPLPDVRRMRSAILGIARKHGAGAVRIFGSAARGDATPRSDIDFLVDMEPGRGLLDQAAMLLELQDLLGREVDVVTMDGLRDRIRDRVLRDAVPL